MATFTLSWTHPHCRVSPTPSHAAGRLTRFTHSHQSTEHTLHIAHCWAFTHSLTHSLTPFHPHAPQVQLTVTQSLSLIATLSQLFHIFQSFTISPINQSDDVCTRVQCARTKVGVRAYESCTKRCVRTRVRTTFLYAPLRAYKANFRTLPALKESKEMQPPDQLPARGGATLRPLI